MNTYEIVFRGPEGLYTRYIDADRVEQDYETLDFFINKKCVAHCAGVVFWRLEEKPTVSTVYHCGGNVQITPTADTGKDSSPGKKAG